MKNAIKGRLKLIENGKMLKYGLYRGYDMFDVDAWLWHNTGRQVGLKITDGDGNTLLDACGRLGIDWRKGYVRYYIRCGKNVIDVDKVLWDNVDNVLNIKFIKFDVPSEGW